MATGTIISPKTLAKLKWAVDQGYDFIFCAMADTYVRPERLAACGFENYDAFGTFISIGPSPKFLCGVSGYFLSQIAAKIILAAGKPVSRQAETYEDGFITSRLRHMKQFLIGDNANFASQGTGPRAWNQVTTRHLHFRLCHELVYIPQMMRDEHRSWENSVTAELIREAKPRKKTSWLDSLAFEAILAAASRIHEIAYRKNCLNPVRLRGDDAHDGR